MYDWLKLAGKVVVVTGGSSGIGKCIVAKLLEHEVKVANFSTRDNGVRHKNLLFVSTDITMRDSIASSINSVVEQFGTIDALVNNAGINIPGLLVDAKAPFGRYELSDDHLEKMIAVNQKGCYLMAQAVVRILTSKKDGVIINMSSASGVEGSEGQSAYAATKAAMDSLTRSWAKELGKHNIRVVGIAPGIMEATRARTPEYEEALAYIREILVEDLLKGYSNTKTIPLGRSGKLEEVADLVCYLLSERSSYITGTTINISGGKTRG